MKRIYAFLFLVFSLSLHEVSYAQCSDAGVCVIGQESPATEHHVSLNYLYGKGGSEDMLMFHTVRFDAQFRLFDRSRLSISVPYAFQSGPLGNTAGIGDLTLLWSQTVFDDRISKLSIQIGGKLSTAAVNAGNLPQAYQPGLGTNDLLLGIAYERESWDAAVAYQVSRGRSDNRITRLKRGDDLLFRAGYTFSLQEAKIHLGALAIKRLQESSIASSHSGQPSSFVNVPGSNQFQINLLGHAVYPLTEQYHLQILLAIPTLEREINIDGLTRSLTLSFGVTYLF